MKCEWDQEVPEDVKNDFLRWLRDFPFCKKLRYLITSGNRGQCVELLLAYIL